MSDRRALLLILLAAAASACGCERSFTRRNTPKPLAPVASPSVQEFGTARPTTPKPSAGAVPAAEFAVQPPRSDSVGGIIPPMPSPRGGAESPIAMATGLEVSAGPIRDRIQERRKDRQDRRDERKEQEKREDEPKKREDEPKKPMNDPLPPPAVPTPPPPPKDIPDRPPAPMPMPLSPSTPGAPATIPVPPLQGTPTAPALNPASAPAPLPAANIAKTLVESSVKQFARIPDFEARQVKREIVGGKQMPTDEIEYRFRQKPLSVYNRVLSEAGQGREVMYVQGQHDDRVHVVTGKGDNRLVGAGYKTDVATDDRRLSEKSRWKVTEAGFSRTLAGLTKHIDDVKSLGSVQRKEYPYPLEAVEWTVRPGVEPQLPRGGKRLVGFDTRVDSPSYLLPVLVITTDDAGREVEYYCFDKFKAPLNTTDADWNPETLGKRR